MESETATQIKSGKRTLRKILIMLSVCVFYSLVNSCQVEEPKPLPKAKKLAMMAVAISDFRNGQMSQPMGAREAKDLKDDDVGSPDGSIFVTEWMEYLDNGTPVTITKTVDDNNTPLDTEDDIITLSRARDIWDGAVHKVDKIVRPREPEPDWSGWDGDTLIWEGQLSVFLDGVKVQYGTIEVTWMKTDGVPPGEEIRPVKIVKELQRADRKGIIEKNVITIDPDGLVDEYVYKIRLTFAGKVVVHSFHYVEIEEDGTVYTKIIRNDGKYGIVRSEKDPRVIEQYSPDDELQVIITEVRDGKELRVRRDYYEEDEIVSTETLRYRYSLGGDEVIVVMKIVGDTVIETIRIQEHPSGYEVTNDGITYIYEFVSRGVIVYDEDMVRLAKVGVTDDGDWEIIYGDGSIKKVSL